MYSVSCGSDEGGEVVDEDDGDEWKMIASPCDSDSWY
jgi:hypothetical protein